MKVTVEVEVREDRYFQRDVLVRDLTYRLSEAALLAIRERDGAVLKNLAVTITKRR